MFYPRFEAITVISFFLLLVFCEGAFAASRPNIPLPAGNPKTDAAANETESSYIVSESSGVGLSREEALLDARRNAVENAVGVLSKGMTQVIDGRVTENIAQLSRAFIEKYEITDERRDAGRYHVGIKAYIRRDSLMEGLVNYDPVKSSIDGISLFTKSATQEQQIREAAETLTEFFASIPVSNYIRCAAASDAFSSREGKLNLEIHFSFDRELYYSVLAPQMATVLNYISTAGRRDVPMFFKTGEGDRIPPRPPESMSENLKLMEASVGNRYIEVPGAGGFANIYLATKNYYFNCYRVHPEAFAKLLEQAFTLDRQGRLAGGAFSDAELVISFRGKGGVRVKEHRQHVRLTNAITFTNAGGIKKSPYSPQKGELPDEQYHSIFIMPYMGVYSAKDADYMLIENDAAMIEVPMEDSQIRLIEGVECRVETTRAE
ncbi:MAG: hypothetical protein LBS53_04775 [Synergistaceae bacterium]|nr:hypothetical protein [Synergistaceae bacterium]